MSIIPLQRPFIWYVFDKIKLNGNQNTKNHKHLTDPGELGVESWVIGIHRKSSNKILWSETKWKRKMRKSSRIANIHICIWLMVDGWWVTITNIYCTNIGLWTVTMMIIQWTDIEHQYSDIILCMTIHEHLIQSPKLIANIFVT